VRIVLDARYRDTRSGAVSYLSNLVPGLLAAGSDHEFVLLRSAGQPRAFDAPCEEVLVPDRSPGAQAIHDQLVLPRLLRRLGADAYHPLKYLGTMFPSCLQVTTAHAITEDYEGSFPISAREAIYWRHMGRRIIRRSAAVIAVSGYIRRFLIDRIGVSRERIIVVPNGVDGRFRQLADDSATGRGPERNPYLLTVGNIFPVKNFLVAVRVLAALAPAFPRLRLRMAGGTDHPYFQQVKAAAVQAGVADRIDFLGYVEPDQLVPLMNRATVLLMPSLTEGCPVTLLEAMACGTPTVASARGGIPEVGGDAVILVDEPTDVDGWVEATRRTLQDDAGRRRLGRAALARSARFTWTETVNRTLDVYDALERDGSLRSITSGPSPAGSGRGSG
jgi:glycosyltransferase involved in cell wall biosynthesis